MATELRFPVEIDSSQAAKELNKVERDIQKLQESIGKNEAKRAPIVEQLKAAQEEATKTYNEIEKLKSALAESEAKTAVTENVDPQTWLNESQRQEEIKVQLAEQEKILAAKEKAAQALEAKDAAIVEKLKEQTAELDKQREKAGELTQQITDASKGADVKAAVEGAKSAVNTGIKNILKYGVGIRSLFVLFRKLKEYTIEAVRAFAENDPETKKSINELKASLSTLKASWGAAFAPIINAVIPMLKTLIGWLTTATNVIAQFFAALAGKSTFKRAIQNTGELSDNLASGAGSAKELNKQMMGIDTLTVAQDSSGGGGGGGASGSGVKYEDVAISAKVKENLELIKNLLEGIAVVAAGILFGPNAAGIALIVFGVLDLVDAFKKFIETGELTKETCGEMGTGFLKIGFGLSILTGSWIPLAIGAFLALGAFLSGWWDEITAWFDKVVGNVNGWFDNVLKTLSDKGNILSQIFIMIYGTVQLTFNAIVGALRTGLSVIKAIFETLAAVVYGFATGDWSAALEQIKGAWADVWTTMKNWGITMINSILGIVESFVNGVINMFNNLVSGISSVFQFFGGSGISWRAGTVSIPRLATGGIVKRGTPFIAGEDGAEAVIPLEKNTQWINLVSDGIVGRMADKFSGLSMPMPAVAGGFVAPPNAFSPSGGYGISPELESKIDALLERLTQRPIEVRTTVELDKRKVGESMYTYTEERNRGRGK